MLVYLFLKIKKLDHHYPWTYHQHTVPLHIILCNIYFKTHMVGLTVKHVPLDPTVAQSKIDQVEADTFSYNINLTSFNDSTREYQTLTWTNVIDNVSTKCKCNI